MGQDKDKPIATDFTTAWNQVRKTGNVYHPQLFASSIYAPNYAYTPTKHRKTVQRPRTYQQTPLQQKQNAAIVASHASNMRCMDNALSSLERLATKARYGVKP